MPVSRPLRIAMTPNCRGSGRASKSRTSCRYRSSKMCSGSSSPGHRTVPSGNSGSVWLTSRIYAASGRAAHPRS